MGPEPIDSVNVVSTFMYEYAMKSNQINKNFVMKLCFFLVVLEFVSPRILGVPPLTGCLAKNLDFFRFHIFFISWKCRIESFYRIQKSFFVSKNGYCKVGIYAQFSDKIGQNRPELQKNGP